MTTILIAKYLGLLFGIMGLGLVFNPGLLKSLVTDMKKSSMVTYIMGLVPLIIGSYLVLIVPLNVSGFSLVITILCYLIFLSGILRIVFTDVWISLLDLVLDIIPHMLIGLMMTLLGVVLVYFGFFM